MEINQLTETWNIHNRINIYLINAIDEHALTDVSASKGRNVGMQFAHMHNVRLMWLHSINDKSIETLHKINPTDILDKNTLINNLVESGVAISELLETSYHIGKIKGFKPHLLAFFTYLVSHESHHRGQIVLSLKQSGHPLNKKIQFGMWEWGVR